MADKKISELVSVSSPADTDQYPVVQGSSTLKISGLQLKAWIKSVFGFETGSGGAVVQTTSRTTGVTLNKICGSITLVSSTTTAGQTTTFTLTNSLISASDVVLVSVRTATGVYFVQATTTGAGSASISVYTPTAVDVAEAPVLSFIVVKAVTA